MKKVRFGEGRSDLFVDTNANILAYEDIDDREVINRLGKGTTTHVSWSGLSGRGVLQDPTPILQIGGYRIDVGDLGAHMYGPEVLPGLSIYVPVMGHRYHEEKLADWPVILVEREEDDETVVLKMFFAQELSEKTLKNAVSGGVSSLAEGKWRRKERTAVTKDGKNKTLILLYQGNPYLLRVDFWALAQRMIPEELKFKGGLMMYQIPFGFTEERGRFFKVEPLCGGVFLRSALLEDDPRKIRKEFLSKIFGKDGWVFPTDGIAYRTAGGQTHIMCWCSRQQVLEKKLTRYASKLTKGQEFNWSKDDDDTIVVEEILPQARFLFRRGEVITSLKKKLAKRLEAAFSYTLGREWADRGYGLSDLPDDKVISLSDFIFGGEYEIRQAFGESHTMRISELREKEFTSVAAKHEARLTFGYLYGMGVVER